MIDISEKLKKLRKERGYTIQTVSDSIGIAVRTYQNYEYGQREISTETLFKIADFYGVTTDYLLGRDNAESSTMDKLTSQFNMTLLEKKIVENYLALPKDMRCDLMTFLSKTVKEVEAESKKS
jgi:putative prophage repressor